MKRNEQYLEPRLLKSKKILGKKNLMKCISEVYKVLDVHYGLPNMRRLRVLIICVKNWVL